MYKSFSDSKVKSFAKFSQGDPKILRFVKNRSKRHTEFAMFLPPPNTNWPKHLFHFFFGFAHKCVRGPVFTENGCISLFLTQKLKVSQNLRKGTQKILRFVKNRSKRHM